MLIVIYVMLMLIMMAITKFMYKTFICPNTIFTILWCLAGILAISNNLGLMRPRLMIHIFIIIAVITFNLVYFIFSKDIQIHSLNETTINLEVNYKLIIAFSIIGLILIIPNTISSVKTLLNLGFNLNAIRHNYLKLTHSGRYYYVFFTNNVPVAIFGAVSLVTAIDFVNGRYKLLAIALINILVGTITFGGRYLILNFVVYYISAYLILKKYIKVKIHKFYIAALVLILIIITLLRGTSGLSVLNMGIIYYVGSFSFLEYIFRNPDLYGLTSSPMYGYLTLGFLFEPIVLVLKFLFNLDIDVPSYYFNIYVQKFVNIGETIKLYYNNNTTMIYTFIRDFGQFGIYIGTALMSLTICFAKNKFQKSGKKMSLYILVVMYSVIINSTMMYTLTSISSSLLIIFLLIFSSEKIEKFLDKIKIKIKDKNYLEQIKSKL